MLAEAVLAGAAPGATIDVLSEFGSEASAGALAAAAAEVAVLLSAPLPVPLPVLPVVPPVLAVLLPAAAPPAGWGAEAAAATAAAPGDPGGGEELPGAGNCPPLDPPPWALFAAGLRVGGLGVASFSAAANSLPLVLSPAGSADAAPPA